MERITMLVCASLLASACGAQAPEGNENTISLPSDSKTDPEFEDKASGVFTKSLNISSWTDLTVGTSTHLCFLSQFSGDFNTANLILTNPNNANSQTDVEGGYAATAIDNNQHWWGAGQNCQATCTPWSNFRAAGSAIPLVADPQFGAVITNGGRNSDAVANLWAGNAFGFIQGVEGLMHGGGEWVSVVQNPSPTDLNGLAIHSQAGDGDIDFGAWAGQAFFGDPNPPWKLVKLAGKSTNPDCLNCDIFGNVNTTGTFLFSVSAGHNQTKTLSMAPVNNGFCAFTILQGQFKGGGEFASITQQSGRWVLTAHAQAGSVNATARCMAYDQT